MKLINSILVSSTTMKLTITGRQANYLVEISRHLTGTCAFFARSLTSRNKVSCKHIIWSMINVLNVPEKSDLLHQVSLTDIELKQILSGAHPVGEHQQSSVGSKNDTPLPGSPSPPPVFLTQIEMEATFEAKHLSPPKQIWKVGKSDQHVKATCCSCKSTMPAGKIFTTVSGLYIPRGQRFAVDRQYFFCADLECIAKKPLASNLATPPTNIETDKNLSKEDIILLQSRGLPVAT